MLDSNSHHVTPIPFEIGPADLLPTIWNMAATFRRSHQSKILPARQDSQVERTVVAFECANHIIQTREHLCEHSNIAGVSVSTLHDNTAVLVTFSPKVGPP